jgi:hypothetical protein
VCANWQDRYDAQIIQIPLLRQVFDGTSSGYSFRRLQSIMKLSAIVSGFACASAALAASSPFKLNAFNKAKPVIEKRMGNEPFKHPELQKRASRFLNSKSEGI